MENKYISQYKIIRIIGKGGMATVYEAVHRHLGHKVAIKVLLPEFSSNKTIRKRFINEAKIMINLKHPNIVSVIDFIDENNVTAIVMEYLDGYNLSEFLVRFKPDINQLTKIFISILKALDFAHQHGIVHRDIKPENVFVLKNGNVKVLDFGIAKLLDGNIKLTSAGTQMGTPLYMSPEQVKDVANVDNLTDIYSLGVVFYHMLEGKQPYNYKTMSKFDIFNKIVNTPLPRLTQHKEYQKVIDKATSKTPTQRYLTCRNFASDIIKIKNGNVNSPPPPPPNKTTIQKNNTTANKPGKTKKKKRKKRTFVPLLFLLLLGGIAYGVYYYYFVYLFNQDNWQKTLIANHKEKARTIIDNGDETYTVLVNKWANDKPKVYLLKIDKNGNKISENRVGSFYAEAKNMIKHKSKYVLAGYKMYDDTGKLWGAKVSSGGKVMWETNSIFDKYKYEKKYYDFGVYYDEYKIIDSDKWSSNYSVIKSKSDDKYIFAGFCNVNKDAYKGEDPIVYSNSFFQDDTEIISISNFTERSNANDLIEKDNAYIFTGFIYTDIYDDKVNKDVLVKKISTSGDILWQKAYGGKRSDKGFKIINAGSNNYLIVGFTKSFGHEEGNGLALTIDSEGNEIWKKTYGRDNLDEFLSVKKDINGGGFILSGYSVNDYGDKDMWFVKIDKKGNIMWSKRIGVKGADEIAQDIIPIENNCYMAVGYRKNNNSKEDVCVVKFKKK